MKIISLFLVKSTHFTAKMYVYALQLVCLALLVPCGSFWLYMRVYRTDAGCTWQVRTGVDLENQICGGLCIKVQVYIQLRMDCNPVCQTTSGDGQGMFNPQTTNLCVETQCVVICSPNSSQEWLKGQDLVTTDYKWTKFGTKLGPNFPIGMIVNLKIDSIMNLWYTYKNIYWWLVCIESWSLFDCNLKTLSVPGLSFCPFQTQRGCSIFVLRIPSFQTVLCKDSFSDCRAYSSNLGLVAAKTDHTVNRNKAANWTCRRWWHNIPQSTGGLKLCLGNTFPSK